LASVIVARPRRLDERVGVARDGGGAHGGISARLGRASRPLFNTHDQVMGVVYMGRSSAYVITWWVMGMVPYPH
jgi:hypothetical protein